ncbi:hypothetical protein CPLU01_08943 [Colletotrichum plurivorum]|uniref:Uncharacterized protein n=1 Tax=Colletotrichum plurivorum TaxID=2175906 RepID=A0A8H6KB85_9PEZI|nr:hypothetical protein CPLU01_08943 [Colletotrichum plurivorum]
MPRRHRLTLSFAALALLTTAAAEDLEAEDVPPECAATCAPIVQLTARCEAQTEQRFGDFDKRWDSFSSSYPFPSLKRRRKAKRLSRRQEDDDSDSETEGAANTAANAAAEQATRACVCGERGFDVQGVMGACAVCVAGNATAVEANEDIKEIMAECGFALPAVAPPAAAPIPGFSTLPPAMLAPIEGSSSTSSTSSSTPPPPPPQNTPSEQTPTPLPPPPPPTTPSEQTPTPPVPEAPPSSVPQERSITPVTVFETPTFRTLPPIVSPNDFSPSRSDLLSGAATVTAGPMGVIRADSNSESEQQRQGRRTMKTAKTDDGDDRDEQEQR